MTKLSFPLFKRLLLITIACFILSLGVNLFITPHNLLAGGVSGIAILLFYITKIPTGLLVIILNIPIFLIGLKKVDLDFTLISLLSMFLFSGFLVITLPLQKYIAIDDVLASAIAGGVLTGLGGGIIFKQRASLGGSDIISIILKQKYSIGISTLMFTINIFVVGMGLFINSLTLSVYTLISMYISSSVVNIVLDGLDRKKTLLIVTDKGEECSKSLISSIKRGVTILDGYGAYTKSQRQILYCTISSRQLSNVKKILLDCDPNAFISIIDVSEVHGRGFKKPVF
jgi:uncharacterized membrane-anchored protein YitT (DUF2179 family)